MRRTVTAIFLFLACLTAGAQQQKLTFMPQWTPQAQFAGFYVALEKGYYEDAGLDVTIRHKDNGAATPMGLLEKGEIQILGCQLLNSVIDRSKGADIVNIMQINHHNGLYAVCNKEVDATSDLNGMRIGRWKTGFEDICNIITLRDKLDLEWVAAQNNGNILFIYEAVDAVLCYSYSEYIKLYLSVGEIEDNHILKFKDEGFDYPEDGLYVTERFYDENKDALDRFVKASAKGWNYARTHQEEALAITFKYIREDRSIITNYSAQKLMLEEYLRLMLENEEEKEPQFAPVDKGTFDKLVDDLYSNGLIGRKVEYEEMIR